MTAWDPARLRGPQFAHVADLIDRVATEPDWPAIERLDAAFASELRSAGVRLVEAAKTRAALLSDGTIDPASLYEVRIVDQGEIPTRPRNPHDFLNALIWAAFPRSKLALTRRLAEIQRARATGRKQLPSTRSREHDRLALVDEGALLCTREATWIFGHAILEHAYAGERAVRGAAIDLVVENATRGDVDRAFAVADLANAVRRGPGIPLPTT
jgi:hypothetical protein